jgi:CHASE2 domain-containing sensor protein/class 3 adenylate cyclase/predicted Ser/Thr protein kinase
MDPTASPGSDSPIASPITMVFTDLVNSTAIKALFPAADLTTRNQLYMDQVLRPHRERVEATLGQYGGRVVKTEGDAYFLVFADPIAAVTWATQTQLSHQTEPIATPTGTLKVRMGMHTGSPLPDGSDFIGQEVDYAARVSGLAQGGQVLLSGATALRLGGRLAVYDHGRHLLKGIGKEPIFEAIYGGNRPLPVRSEKPLRWVGVVLLSMVVGGLLGSGLHVLGLLEGPELRAYDQQLRLRPQEKPDDRLLLIKVTDADVAAQRRAGHGDRSGSLANATFSQLLQKLLPLNPRVVAVDIFRTEPIDPRDRTLKAALTGDDRLITACQFEPLQTLGDVSGFDPPPEVPRDRVASQVGFVDTIRDNPDGVIRRQLISLTPAESSNCSTPYALSLTAALQYLRWESIVARNPDAEGNFPIGRTWIKLFRSSNGVYRHKDDRGSQILLNYRANPIVAPELTLGQVLRGDFDPKLVENRLVLIGSTALIDGRRDYDRTPYAPNPQRPMAGVEIQAHSISQLLSAVLDSRPLIWILDKPAAVAWIFGWAAIGSLVVVVVGDRRRTKAIAFGLLILALVASHFVMLLAGGWLPIVAATVGALGSAGMSLGYWQWTAGPGLRRRRAIGLVPPQPDRPTPVQANPDRASQSIAPGAEATVQLFSLPSIDGAEISLGDADRADATATLTETRLGNATLGNADLDAANLEDANLGDTSLGETQLQVAVLEPIASPEDAGETSLQETAVGVVDRVWTKPERPDWPKDRLPAQVQRPAKPQAQPTELAHRYQVERILSAGGFGVTYLARDPQRPGSPRCVVKRLSPQTPEIMPIARRLFKAEAESLELLGHHDQVPRLLAYFEQDDTFYLVEEFIEGRSLSDELQADRPQSETYVIALLLELLAVLAFIHDRQIIHRDLKPDNVIRRSDGSLVLIDFGAVKQAVAQSGRNTVAIGTRGYAAPEQLAGQPIYSSDLFALGMIAIEALTGIDPHRLDPDPETGNLEWHHLCQISLPLRELVDRLSAYHFNDRYETADQVLIDLEFVMATLRGPAR